MQYQSINIENKIIKKFLMMETKAIKITPLRKCKMSYTTQLMEIKIGESAYFRLAGSSYTNFYNAKWMLEKRKKVASFEMRKVNDTTLRVTRLS